jgi:hypothetical protein
MTAAITTIQRAVREGGVNHFARRLGAALTALSDRVSAWSGPYYKSRIGDELAVLPPSERIDAALRWHAHRGRIV